MSKNKIKLIIFMMNTKKVLYKLKKDIARADVRVKLETVRQRYLLNDDIILILGKFGMFGEYIKVLEEYESVLSVD